MECWVCINICTICLTRTIVGVEPSSLIATIKCEWRKVQVCETGNRHCEQPHTILLGSSSYAIAHLLRGPTHMHYIGHNRRLTVICGTHTARGDTVIR